MNITDTPDAINSEIGDHQRVKKMFEARIKTTDGVTLGVDRSSRGSDYCVATIYDNDLNTSVEVNLIGIDVNKDRYIDHLAIRLITNLAHEKYLKPR